VDQQPVFEVQTPGARIEVATGDERVIVVNQQALQVKRVLLVAPEMQIEQPPVDGVLVRLGRLAS